MSHSNEDDFLSRNTQSTCVGLPPPELWTTSGSHRAHTPGQMLRFNGRLTWLNNTLLLLVVVCFFCQSVVGQSQKQQPIEYSCIAGQNHRRFPGCICGEFAEILSDDLVQGFQDSGFEVFKRNYGRRNQNSQYYVCSQCTICGDGIKIEKQCTQKSDTVCSQTECENPMWDFHFGSKSCKPPSSPRVPASTKATTTTQRTTAVQRLVPANNRDPESDDSRIRGKLFTLGQHDGSASFGTSGWLLQHIQPVITGIFGTLLIVIVLVIVMMWMVCRWQRRQAPLQCSSHSTSSSSLPEPESV